jgi:hypothetical protein
VIKLDTQGSELSILLGSSELLSSNRIVGIEMESTMLAEPIMENSGKLADAVAALEAHGYELLSVRSIEGGSLYGSRRKRFDRHRARRYVNECDAIFSLRRPVVETLPAQHRTALFGFYLTNRFFDEARSLIESDDELREVFGSAACQELSRYLKKRT